MNVLTRIAAIGAISSMTLGTALASDPSNTARTVGLGYGQTIGGVNGVSVRYGLGGGLALEGVVAYSDSSLTQTSSKTNGKTSGSMDVGVAFDYKPSALRGEKVAASFTGDFNYMTWSEGTISAGSETDTSYSDMAFGVGMRTEFWPASWMSLNTRLGLSVSPNGEGQQNPEGGGDTDYGGMDIALGGDFFGGAGVTFWFR